MSVRVNGAWRDDVPGGASVHDVVVLLGVPAEGRGVAVALDGIVVPRGAWESTRVEAGAQVEVVTAVQGG